VWFSESACSSIAYLDPSKAQAGTSQGFTELEQPGSAFRSPSAPADIAVDRGNNLWWAGEYGDQIEQLKPSGDNGLRFRGSVRRGLTEGPIADEAGNLWVVESGGNLITRISGVTQGRLVPFGLPAGLEANTSDDTLTGERLRDTSSVTVRVFRGGNLVAQADAPVSGGRFTIGDGDWEGDGDAVAGDDIVRVQPKGQFDRAELDFRVARLSASVGADGAVTGQATAAGQALADRVQVASDDGSGSSGIDGADGAWRVQLNGPASGRVSWTGATVAAGFRTVTRFDAPSQGGGATTDQGAPVGDGGGPVEPPRSGDQQAQPQPPAGDKPKSGGSSKTPARPAACTSRQWLHGSAKAPKVLLLGMTTSRLRACLGRPTSSTATKWRYGKGLTITLRRGRVTGYALTDRRFRSARGKAGVGGTLRNLRKALPGLRRVARSTDHRATLGRTQIRVRVDRRGRITRIAVTRRGS
jgi:hypothetical protein